MKKARNMVRVARSVILVVLIIGAALGFPNDPESSALYWGGVLLEEFICAVHSN